jgi:Holliday junction resolvasome RuvABC endonuclease subunit
MTQREAKAAPAVICACDPDTVSPAFAIFSGGNLAYWNAPRGRMDSLLSEVKVLIEQWQPDLLVIENQYLPPSADAARRFRSLSRLISARAMITAVFVLAGIRHELVEPFSWQRSLGESRLGRDELKRLSMLKASDIARQEIQDHNLADAIKLGFWFIKTHPHLKAKDTGCVFPALRR